MSYLRTINCLKFSIVTICLLFLQTLSAQSKKQMKEYGTDRFPEVDAMVTQKQKMLGQDLVVMIWKDTLVYKKEMGEFNSKTVAPLEAASSWLTAAFILQMVDEGKISLDDKIARYIPIFDKYGKSYITVRHCLSHMTGIQADKSGLFQKKKHSSLEEVVDGFAKNEIQTNPGTEFRYSNIGPMIAARVVEVVYKKKFDMLIRQKLLVPLGMRQTSFSTLDGSAPNPADGANSTATDYMNFLQMLLNNGRFNGRQVLSESSVKELKKIHTSAAGAKYGPKGAEGFGYALGSWVAEEGKNGEAGTLSGTGFSGTWPVVDFCRGYACLFFVKNPAAEQTSGTYMAIKGEIDEKMKGACQ
jgi:hypothetical protein